MALQRSVATIPNLQRRQRHPTNNLANQHCIKASNLAYPNLISSIVTCSQQHEYFISPSPPANKSVAAVIFGDGSDSRLYPLTKWRSEGAIPIAGNYRLIDAVISNCINSDITKIYALTQFNSTSLNSHLSRAYSGVNHGKESFVEVIAAYQSPEDQGWFQGNADAVRRCLWVLEEFPITEYFILPGHHLYKMDYQKIVETHRKSKADITIMGLEATRDHDPGFGFLKINNENRVIEFKEKCDTEASYENVVHNTVECLTIPSTGIYLINRDIMKKLLTENFPKANDFGGEVIQAAISMGIKVQAYLFGGYWEDMRSIKAFYQANMETARKSTTGFNFHDRESPVYTKPRSMPPSIVTDAVIIDSVIGDGSILKGCKIKRTVVGLQTRIGEGAVVEDSVIMGSDIHQTDIEMILEDRKARCIPIGIGKNALVRNAIIDKNARIGSNVMVSQIRNGYIYLNLNPCSTGRNPGLPCLLKCFCNGRHASMRERNIELFVWYPLDFLYPITGSIIYLILCALMAYTYLPLSIAAVSNLFQSFHRCVDRRVTEKLPFADDSHFYILCLHIDY